MATGYGISKSIKMVVVNDPSELWWATPYAFLLNNWQYLGLATLGVGGGYLVHNNKSKIKKWFK